MSSLYPESHLAFSPQLAATIGVEEAILLQVLCDARRLLSAESRSGHDWYQLAGKQLDELVPFWSPQDVQRIVENLRDKGLILVGSAPYAGSRHLRFALQPRRIVDRPDSTVQPASPGESERRANRLANHWHPDDELLKLLAQQGVPREFSRDRIAPFVQYYRERGIAAHAWGNRFIKWVMRDWREHELHNARLQQMDEPAFVTENPELPMPTDWQPSTDTLDYLRNRAGIDAGFIDDALPEFIIYWKGTGQRSNTWDARFIKHIRTQWEFFRHALQHDTKPKPIPADWRPSAELWDILRMANIDAAFAEQLIPEFIMKWRERNEIRPSWNKQFLWEVKREWQRHNGDPDAPNARTRDRTLEQDLTDHSWAE